MTLMGMGNQALVQLSLRDHGLASLVFGCRIYCGALYAELRTNA